MFTRFMGSHITYIYVLPVFNQDRGFWLTRYCVVLWFKRVNEEKVYAEQSWKKRRSCGEVTEEM